MEEEGRRWNEEFAAEAEGRLQAARERAAMALEDWRALQAAWERAAMAAEDSRAEARQRAEAQEWRRAVLAVGQATEWLTSPWRKMLNGVVGDSLQQLDLKKKEEEDEEQQQRRSRVREAAARMRKRMRMEAEAQALEAAAAAAPARAEQSREEMRRRLTAAAETEYAAWVAGHQASPQRAWGALEAAVGRSVVVGCSSSCLISCIERCVTFFQARAMPRSSCVTCVVWVLVSFLLLRPIAAAREGRKGREGLQPCLLRGCDSPEEKLKAHI